MSWYEVKNADAIPSPALLVYPDRVQENIQHAVQIAGSPARLWPHVKTHKMRVVTDRLLAAGIRSFKCATLKEARMLAEAGTDLAEIISVLVAYPLVGPAIAQLTGLRAEFPNVHFACLTDNRVSAQRLSDAFAANPLDVFLDLNVGMNRTGIKPTDAPALYHFCATLPNVRVAGLHAYDGHIRDTDLMQRTQRTDESFALADGVRQAIADAGGPTLPLIMGGTPSFSCHAQRPDVLLSPGTFVFWDAGYGQTLPDLPFIWAAALLMRVISVVDEQTLCLDLGHKSVAAENPLPRVVFLNEPDAQPIGQSEEHVVVRIANAHRFTPGDVWYGVPIHICPTVNLYDSVNVISDNQVVDNWLVTARGH
ncbi:D-TA family PLP-dependent enzyme [Spirosoma montaniterrae]|uniref:D-serine dehydratase-like domain-containing protein n=1 Tax=Spirosoma montaniterrae TaxID=1178516 RepID=A0A1P9WSS9_9BACT|nr:D-TA family PLP-dependent enzyme [Spirosoma montaniterrae]AQG78434.1 hypothetical protein AWR27_03220 [Spirosoma montaniterrae]